MDTAGRRINSLPIRKGKDNIVYIIGITIVNYDWIFFPTSHKGIESFCAINDFMGQKVKQL